MVCFLFLLLSCDFFGHPAGSGPVGLAGSGLWQLPDAEDLLGSPIGRKGIECLSQGRFWTGAVLVFQQQYDALPKFGVGDGGYLEGSCQKGFQCIFHLFNLYLDASRVECVVFPSQNTELSLCIELTDVIGGQDVRADSRGLDGQGIFR